MTAAHPPVILLTTTDALSSLLSQLLQETGHTVTQTAAYQDCVRLVAAQHPPLVIIDADVAGIDAFALAQEIREQFNRRILLLIDETPEAAEAVFASGADDYAAKPIQRSVLRQRLRRLLELSDLQQRLDASERRWRQAFDQNHAIKLLIDPNSGSIVDANRAACGFYGYTLEEMRRKKITDLDTTPKLEEDDEELHPTLFNFRHRLSSGEQRDVKIFSGPLDVDGQTLIYSIIYDNTKRMRAEAAEHDERTMTEALRHMTAVLSSTLDQNELLDRILEQIQHVVANDYANIMLIDGGIAHIVRSRGYEQRIPPDAIQAIHFPVGETANLRWMIENGRPLVIADVETYPGWNSTGVTMWIRSHVSAPIRLGNHVIGFLNLDSAHRHHFHERDAERLLAFADQAAVAIRNARMYERIRRQTMQLEQRVQERTAELDYERHQLRAILDAMAEGVAYTEYVDGHWQVLYINQALTGLTGFSADEWMTHSLMLFMDKAATQEDFERVVHSIYAALVKQGVWHQEIKMQRKDGTLFDMNSTTTRVVGSDGRLVGAVTVMRDVSQERALQAQKTRFVAYASHELRTPITNIKTRLYLLRKQPERIADHLRVLEDVTDRMQRLVEDLLDISRFERGIIHLKQRMLALQDIVDKSVSIQEPEAERNGLRLTAAMHRDPLYVYVDPERIIQVITNLLTNAINYTPPGGRITVHVSAASEDEVSYALVEVIDTGIGISKEHLPHIFQAFYRVISQVEGTGLGLNISKEIVELHGGKIGVESEVERGSRFYFYLPTLPLDVPPAGNDITTPNWEEERRSLSSGQ
jgi:PAS domain S-box-containing protein